jgi:hypothetical protein
MSRNRNQPEPSSLVNHRTSLAWFCLLGCAMAGKLCAQDRPLSPSDFAYGREVQLPLPPGATSAALVSLDIPLEIYQRSRSDELADVWVFDAEGTQLPHAFLPAQTPSALQPSEQVVPFFPIAREHVNQPLELSIAVSRSADGHIMSLHSTGAQSSVTTAQPAAATAAYILDLRSLPGAACAAHFSWQAAPPNLLVPLALETSDDLIHWQSLATQGGLLHLEHAGQHIERDRVEWSPLHTAFMRVRATGRDSLPALLQEVRVEVVPAGAPPTLEALRSETQTVDAEHGIYHFDLGGPVPVQELEIELPSDNSIISAELWARDTPNGPARRIAEARFYRIASDGKSLFGPRISTGLEHARYYELHIDRTRPGLGQARPTLVTYHAPERLLFLRHGTGPYTVAYGRYGVSRRHYAAEDLLALVPSEPKQPLNAQLAEPKPLGGDHLLTPPAAPLPIKTYLLWTILVAGVIGLLLFAYRLSRATP